MFSACLENPLAWLFGTFLPPSGCPAWRLARLPPSGCPAWRLAQLPPATAPAVPGELQSDGTRVVIVQTKERWLIHDLHRLVQATTTRKGVNAEAQPAMAGWHGVLRARSNSASTRRKVDGTMPSAWVQDKTPSLAGQNTVARSGHPGIHAIHVPNRATTRSRLTSL